MSPDQVRTVVWPSAILKVAGPHTRRHDNGRSEEPDGGIRAEAAVSRRPPTYPRRNYSEQVVRRPTAPQVQAADGAVAVK